MEFGARCQAAKLSLLDAVGQLRLPVQMLSLQPGTTMLSWTPENEDHE
jgi:hypothetical protein